MGSHGRIVAAGLLAVMALAGGAMASARVESPAAGAALPRVTGPRWVTPGHRVTFIARRLRPHGKVGGVQLQPTQYRGGNGFAVFVRLVRRANAQGIVRLRFRWPRHYFACSSASNCRRVAWEHRQRVDVFVDALAARGPAAVRALTRVVRVR